MAKKIGWIGRKIGTADGLFPVLHRPKLLDILSASKITRPRRGTVLSPIPGVERNVRA
jgi:hypothetical protein